MRSIRTADLARAIRRGEVIPYFQPLIRLRNRTLVGFEVLARWNHPRRGLLTPHLFIGLAERTGLIGQLSESLLRRAGGIARSWPEGMHLSLNTSPRQLQDGGFADRLAAGAEHIGFSLSRLTIEVTESALITPLDVPRRQIEELKAEGVRLSLDDFGTGYASLSLLQALPFDSLKIDASFVRSMQGRRESRKIVAAAIGLGHSLGIETVAEGVETEEQAAILLGLGCGVGQGWLFGVPSPEADLLVQIPALAPHLGEEVMLGLEALPSERLAQLQALYDGAPVGIAFLDCHLRFVSLNRYLAGLHGLPVAAHIGRTVTEILPDIFEQIAPLLQRALTGETIKAWIARGDPTPDESGRRRAYCVSYNPARDVAGEIVGIAVLVIDVGQPPPSD